MNNTEEIIKIVVLPRHLKEAIDKLNNRSTCYICHCPVALAILEHYNILYRVAVSANYVLINSTVYDIVFNKLIIEYFDNKRYGDLAAVLPAEIHITKAPPAPKETIQ